MGSLGFPCGSAGKRIHLQCGRPGFDPWVGKIPWRREKLPAPVFWPGEFPGLYILRGCKELDMTERLHFHFSRSCIGEGNGNPLQCSCLENPRDGGASWAAVYGVAQSRTRLKRLSSSNSRADNYWEHLYNLGKKQQSCSITGATFSWLCGSGMNPITFTVFSGS